jgi:hypothetical protein
VKRATPLPQKKVVEWDLKYGEHLEYFREIEEETGVTPEPLENRPEVPRHLAGTIEAFWLLSGGRPPGFGGPGGIPTADIIAIAPLFEPDDPLRFLRVIRKLDALLLAHLAKKAEEERKRSSAAKKPR